MKNALRLSIAAGALAFGGALFAQSGTSSTEGAAPSGATSATPASGAVGAQDKRGPDQRRHPSAHKRTDGASAFMPGVDADRDGRISRDELLAAQKRQLERFDQADTDKDGVLTREEQRASRQAMRDDHRKRMAERRGSAQPAAPQPEQKPQG